MEPMTREQLRVEVQRCVNALTLAIRARVEGARLTPDEDDDRAASRALAALDRDGRPVLAPMYGDLVAALGVLERLTPAGQRIPPGF